MQLVDTHCHLDEEAFEPDRDAVVAKAASAGLVEMITIGTTAASSRRAVELAGHYPRVFAAVGIQPNYVHEAKAGDWDAIVELTTADKVVAIGETGLDRYWDHAPFELQVEYFTKHLDLARRLDIPFVVHCRNAEAETVAQLRQAALAGPLRGVMHSFSGSLETAEACLELGLYLSFAGMVTFKNAHALRAVAAVVPADRILIETDSPYLAPGAYRGKRNEPAYVALTAASLAEKRGVPVEEFAALTTRNAQTLFRFPEHRSV
jgi:TatD DNase family protein